MVSALNVLNRLKEKADPNQLKGMARYGMVVEARLGVSIPDVRAIAKELSSDHQLALTLWKTGIAEARILASMIDEPAKVTESQMESWVRDFNSWDVCDQVCMNLFEKTPLAWKKISDWSGREEEFVKRGAFALMACLAWHEKTLPDERLIAFFPILKRGSTDERSFVKKAVSWALRNIGKKNLRLNKEAIGLAREIRKIDSRAARWIASDVVRELEGEAVRKRLRRNRR